MPLPGKLCVGILEEDNPQKSYFRFKPLIVESGDHFDPFTAAKAYPEDGCIRIVPDKNESSHFKARMRRLGLYAFVDLRDHPGSHDKIRINKNYSGDGQERNAHILYSDVVREPGANELFALLPLAPEQADGALLSEAPSPRRALLAPEGAPLPEIWTVEPVPEQESFRLVREGGSVALDDLQVFELPGFQNRTLTVAVLKPQRIARAAELPVGRGARAAEPAPLTEPIRMPEGFRIEPPAPEKAPESAKEAPGAEATSPEAPPRPQPEKPRAEAPGSKRAVRDRAHAEQTGLNPRRSHCLQEIIDDKWRRSRMDQLGAPPSLVTGEPVPRPADAALSAVQAAWSRRDQREELLSALARMDGLDEALDARRSALRESAVNAQLNELEAQRLRLLDEMARLRRGEADVRAALKAEIRRDEADALADAVARTERARAACARSEREAARSRAVADGIRDAMAAMRDGRFEKRLREFAIHSRAAELLRGTEPFAEAPLVAGTDADADALVARVLETFAAAGMPIDRADAVNLLVCAAQGALLLVSGPSGSGKTTTVRLLARALGLEEARYAEFAPGTAPLEGDAAVRRLCTPENRRAAVRARSGGGEGAGLETVAAAGAGLEKLKQAIPDGEPQAGAPEIGIAAAASIAASASPANRTAAGAAVEAEISAAGDAMPASAEMKADARDAKASPVGIEAVTRAAKASPANAEGGVYGADAGAEKTAVCAAADAVCASADAAPVTLSISRAAGAELGELGPLPAAEGGFREAALSMALLDDANLPPSPDPTRGLTQAAERGELLLCLTLQDDGEPIPANLYGRAFTLRLRGEAADSPWRPSPAHDDAPRPPVSAAALRRAFAPILDELPEAQCRRMEKLRADLALLDVRLPRKTLDALWNYCAAAIPRMPLEPSAVLDGALAQRALPAVLASAPLDALAALPKALEDLPRCRALLESQLPVRI